MRRKVKIVGTEVLKSGVNAKTKKAWTLMKVHIDPITLEGTEYTSFSTFNGHKEGIEEVELEVNINGQWKNLREVMPKSAVAQKADDLEKRVTALEERVKKLEGGTIPVIEEDEFLG